MRDERDDRDDRDDRDEIRERSLNSKQISLDVAPIFEFQPIGKFADRNSQLHPY